VTGAELRQKAKGKREKSLRTREFGRSGGREMEVLPFPLSRSYALAGF